MKTENLSFSQVSTPVNREPRFNWAKILYKILVFFPVFIFLATPFFFSVKADAATGINKQINFQGKLVDNNGLNVSDGSYSVVFTLYDASSGGTNLWTETDSVTTTAGIFQVALGAVNTSLGNVNFNSDTIYLGIKVGTDAEMTPRIRFSSVPYALNAGSLSGVVATQSASSFTMTGGTSTLKTLTVNDNTQLNNAGLTFANGKTVAFSNGLTFAGSDSTTITFQGSDTYVGRTTNDILTNKTIGSTGLTFTGATTDITTGTNEDFTLSPNGAGKFGVNTAGNALRAAIDLRGNSGTLAVASVSGTTSFASLVTDNSGTGDLFTASSSGTTRFTIENSGNILVGTTSDTTDGHKVVIKSADHQLGLVNSSGNVWGLANWNGTNGLYYQYNSVNQMFLSPTGSLELAYGLAGGSYSPQATLDVRGNSGTTPVASFLGTTAKSAMIVDNSGVGDLFVASQAGTTKFRIANNGDTVLTAGINLGGSVGTGSQCLLGGATASWGSCSSIPNYLRINAGAFSLINDTADFLFGNVASGSALFKLSPRGTSPTASVSANTSAAAMVVDNKGTGDLFTASSSGLNRFVITQNGNVGIGTTAPTQQLQVTNSELIGPDVWASGKVSTLFLGNTNTYFQNAYAGNATLLSDNPMFIQTTTGSALTLGTNSSTNQLYLQNGGNVGIGTASPSNNLTIDLGSAAPVDSGLTIKGNTSTFGDLGIQIQNTGTGGIDWYIDSSNTISQYGAGTLNFVRGPGGSDVLSLGNQTVSINGVNPLATLDVRNKSANTPTASISGSTSGAGLLVDNSGTGDIITASAEGMTRFRMANNGSVLFQGDTFTSIGTGASGNDGSNAVGNAIGDSGSLIPNSNFESAIGSSLADGWFPSATSSAMFSAETTNIAKGSRAIKATITNSRGAVYSTCVPVAGPAAGTYNLEYYIKSTGTLTTVQGALQTFTSKANCQSDTTPTVVTAQVKATTAAWVKNGATLGALSTTATWGRAMFQFVCASGCTSVPTYIDGVRLVQSALTNGLDYAENYPADPANMPEAGDVVSIVSSGSATIVKKADRYMDTSAIGVVSTNPGETLDDSSMGDAKVPVALAGRIPTKVSTINGPIHVGDYLTASTIPGVAVKAISAGQVIGQAMSEYDDSDPTAIGSVVMFVKNTYYNGIPLTYASGLTEDHAQGDLGFLSELVSAAQQTASESAALKTVSTDRVVAGLDVITPHVIADKVSTNTIASANKGNIGIQLEDGKELQIGDASGSAGIRFDGLGNAYFSGTITANNIKVNGLEILQSDLQDQQTQIASLSSMISGSVLSPTPATDSATPTATPPMPSISDKEASMAAYLAKFDANLVNIQALAVAKDATVDGSFRVKGDSIVEGMLHVVDTLTTANLLVNQTADFFGNTIFHSGVTFSGPPTFSDDTAGYATVEKGSNKVDVTFKKEYVTQPIINASLVSTKLTDETFTADKVTGICSENDDMQTCQDKADKEILSDSIKYVVTNRSTKGFSIVLEGNAKDTETFSWMALAVGD